MPRQADAVAAAVHAVDPGLPVLGLAGSAFFAAAERLGLRTVPEAFADRAYRPDGQLVSRREPGAVLHDADGDRRPGVVDGRPTGRSPPWTVRPSRSPWNRFACTVIRRARCRSPRPSAIA